MPTSRLSTFIIVAKKVNEDPIVSKVSLDSKEFSSTPQTFCFEATSR